MTSCFVTGAGAALPSAKRGALCARATRTASATGAPELRRTAATMTAGSSEKKQQSFLDWLYKKIMHNFDDEEYGYEPFFVDAQNAREEAAKKVYEENGKDEQ